MNGKSGLSINLLVYLEANQEKDQNPKMEAKLLSNDYIFCFDHYFNFTGLK